MYREEPVQESLVLGHYESLHESESGSIFVCMDSMVRAEAGTVKK